MQLATLEGNRMVIGKVDTKMKSPSDNKVARGECVLCIGDPVVLTVNLVSNHVGLALQFELNLPVSVPV